MSKSETTKPEVRPKNDEIPKPYSTIAEVDRLVRSHIPEKALETITKEDEVNIIRKWALRMGRLLRHLGYRITILKCADNLNIIVVSEFRLVDPRTAILPTAEIIEGNKEYSEFRMRPIKQRTFTWQGLNKHGTWAGLTELGYLKFWTKKYEILRYLNINMKQFRYAPIVFVDSSDGQKERLRVEGSAYRKSRAFPDDVDVTLIKNSYDLTYTERAMTQLKLILEEMLAQVKRHDQELDNVRDDAIYTVAEQCHNFQKSGKLRQKPPNRIIEFWNEHGRAMVKYIVILLIIWVIGSLIYAFITETPLFGYLQPNPVDVNPGGGSTATPDVGGVTP